MAKLGLPVVYHAHDEHKRVVAGRAPVKDASGAPVKGTDGKHVYEDIIHASIHHPELEEFAAVVTRVRDDALRCDLVIFPPNREPRSVDDVPYGRGGHSWRHIDEHDDARDPVLGQVSEGDAG